MPHRIVFDLDDLPFHPNPVVSIGKHRDTTAVVVSFGWTNGDQVACTSPERLESFAVLLLEAARDLRNAKAPLSSLVEDDDTSKAMAEMLRRKAAS